MKVGEAYLAPDRPSRTPALARAGVAQPAPDREMGCHSRLYQRAQVPVLPRGADAGIHSGLAGPARERPDARAVDDCLCRQPGVSPVCVPDLVPRCDVEPGAVPRRLAAALPEHARGLSAAARARVLRVALDVPGRISNRDRRLAGSHRVGGDSDLAARPGGRVPCDAPAAVRGDPGARLARPADRSRRRRRRDPGGGAGRVVLDRVLVLSHPERRHQFARRRGRRDRDDRRGPRSAPRRPRCAARHGRGVDGHQLQPSRVLRLRSPVPHARRAPRTRSAVRRAAPDCRGRRAPRLVADHLGPVAISGVLHREQRGADARSVCPARVPAEGLLQRGAAGPARPVVQRLRGTRERVPPGRGVRRVARTGPDPLLCPRHARRRRAGPPELLAVRLRVPASGPSAAGVRGARAGVVHSSLHRHAASRGRAPRGAGALHPGLARAGTARPQRARLRRGARRSHLGAGWAPRADRERVPSGCRCEPESIVAADAVPRALRGPAARRDRPEVLRRHVGRLAVDALPRSGVRERHVPRPRPERRARLGARCRASPVGRAPSPRVERAGEGVSAVLGHVRRAMGNRSMAGIRAAECRRAIRRRGSR